MPLLRRRTRAPGPSSRRRFQLNLESLEPRQAMSASPTAGLGLARTIMIEPAYRTAGAGTLATALEPGSYRVGEEGFGTATPHGYTPHQIRAAYAINTINFGSIVGDGAGQTLAIVDAYDDPDLVDSSSPAFGSSDLARFDQAFGLPDPPVFEKLNEFGTASALPGTDPSGAGNPFGNWEIEEALDVEWAHAIAPGASIDLVETISDDGADMYTGATTAAGLAGVSVVSMSWGSGEYSGEQSFDSSFTTPSGHQGVTFVASSGDSGSPGLYPAYSPNVVAAGGTSLSVTAAGSYASETAWSGGGGGISSYENEPNFQREVQNSDMRTIPDIAFDANPSTGVSVYDSYNGTGADPWEQIGGTSVAAPCLAAIFAIADQGRMLAGMTTLDGASQTMAALYALPATDFSDVTSGYNGGFSARPGYDEVTGLGTPKANFLVSDLAAYGIAGNLRVIAQPPATVTAGSAFEMSLMVEDADGSLATSYEGSVTVALANNPERAAAAGTITVLAKAGIATFADLTLDRAGSGFAFVLNAGGTAFAMTTSVTVLPAAPTRLVVISEPSMPWNVGAPFGLTVAVEDNFGNLETSYSGQVTASPAGWPARNALGGTRLVAVNQGLAVFSNLFWKKIGTGDAVKLTAGSALVRGKTTVSRVVTAPTSLARPLRWQSRLARQREANERDRRTARGRSDRVSQLDQGRAAEVTTGRA
jgi:hypothetical protein